MRYIIDRFEGTFAICETEERAMVNIDKVMIPKGAKEGDTIIIEGSKVTIDDVTTREREGKIKKLAEDLWK